MCRRNKEGMSIKLNQKRVNLNAHPCQHIRAWPLSIIIFYLLFTGAIYWVKPVFTQSRIDA